MSKKFWLTRLLGKFGKKDKAVVESVVEEPTIEELSTVAIIEEPNIEEPNIEEFNIEEPNIEELTLEASQEVYKKAKVLTAEEKRRIRVLRYLGYQD